MRIAVHVQDGVFTSFEVEKHCVVPWWTTKGQAGQMLCEALFIRTLLTLIRSLLKISYLFIDRQNAQKTYTCYVHYAKNLLLQN